MLSQFYYISRDVSATVISMFHSAVLCIRINILIVLLLLLPRCPSSLNMPSSFGERLASSIETAEGALKSLRDRWQVDKYPAVLKSCYMSEASYDSMVNRMTTKILLAESLLPQRLVVAFTGSSVTAGHDSLYSQAFPAVVERIMAPALSELNVEFKSRNVAMGNNPCFPYDACVRTFAGDDADIIHWEQSYNCGFGDKSVFIEQFIRQSVLLPSRPIVVLSGSSTTNWHARDCPKEATLAASRATVPYTDLH